MINLVADSAITLWFDRLGPLHGWAIATAVVVSACCAIVGTLLVVRQMSLLGDAISHAVLPGLVVAVLCGAQPGGVGVLLGATVAAMSTVWSTRFLFRHAGLWEDASVGVTFTTLFAAGVLLITVSGSRVDLDPGCVLYGILELVPFDTVSCVRVGSSEGFCICVVCSRACYFWCLVHMAVADFYGV